MKILFASSEAHPMIKTGGLADVAGSLPRAIRNMKHDIRLVIPAYRQVLEQADKFTFETHRILEEIDQPVRIITGRLPGSTVTLYLVDTPELFDREGTPYSDKKGRPWVDNAERYSAFCRTITAIAMDEIGLDWQPDLVHCNDWQTGLVPPMLSVRKNKPPTVFTIHNLAYQGLFDWKVFKRLNLPTNFWSTDAMEFHNQFSFIKGGLVFADWITTVSPTYAEEIRTREFGCGMEGLLEHRKDNLTGITNGIDYSVWNPGRDINIPVQYNQRSLFHKIENKRALQENLNLPVDNNIPLLAVISRLVDQKGIDLILDIVPRLAKQGAQLVILGVGDSQLEVDTLLAEKKYPRTLGVIIDYDEPLAHHIEAGADMFLMPSRFEPCGLNQIYSQRYGTVPIVRHTGGLADTVTNTTLETLANKTATGFTFRKATSTALWDAIQRALKHYKDQDSWQQIMTTGMKQDFSWKRSAEQYLALYERLLAPRESKKAKTA